MVREILMVGVQKVWDKLLLMAICSKWYATDRDGDFPKILLSGEMCLLWLLFNCHDIKLWTFQGQITIFDNASYPILSKL